MQQSHLKGEVLKLRRKGYSYSLIRNKLAVSKSTLSNWLKDVPFRPNKEVLERIKTGPLISGQKKHNQKVRDIFKIRNLAKKELGKLSKRDLWLLGLGLYMGEGSKTYETIRVINSDPQIMQLAVEWLKKVCGLSIENITIAIHLYPDNNIKASQHYWSKLLKIPLRQFRKTQIDKRKNKSGKKKKKLPHGTAHLTVVSRGDVKFGVKLHRKIIGWAEGALGQI